MNTDKKTYLILILLAFVFTGCSTNFELEKYIDNSASFQLTINKINLKTGLTTKTTEDLDVNSIKWNKIIEWAGKNKEDWQFSIASHIGDVYINQGDFRLIYSEGSKGIVVEFIDKQGEIKQYIKEIVKGELDFMTILNIDKVSSSDTLKNKCKKCSTQVLKNTHDNIENLSYKIIREFLCTIDKPCINNAEFSEWSNEMLFIIIEKNPTLYFSVLNNMNNKRQQYILSEFENSIIDIDYQKMYNSIEKLNIGKELKKEYLNSLKIIARKYNSEIEN